MIVLYETRSERNARDFERRSNDYYGDDCDNEKDGGGRSGGPSFCLYVVANR